MQFPAAREGFSGDGRGMQVSGLALGGPRLPIAIGRAGSAMSVPNVKLRFNDAPPRPNYGALSMVGMEYVDVGFVHPKRPGDLIFTDTHAPTPFTGPSGRYMICGLTASTVSNLITEAGMTPEEACKRFRFLGVLKEISSSGKRSRDSERVTITVCGLADTYDDIAEQSVPIGAAIFAYFSTDGVDLKLDVPGRNEAMTQYVGIVTRCCTTGVRPVRARLRKPSEGGFRDLSILV